MPIESLPRIVNALNNGAYLMYLFLPGIYDNTKFAFLDAGSALRCHLIQGFRHDSIVLLLCGSEDVG